MQPAVQHPARVGDGLGRLGRADHLGLGQAPLGAVLQVELGLVEDGEHGGRLAAHRLQAFALHHRERLRAREVEEEKVVLHEVMPERGKGQRAARELAHEGVPRVARPVRGGGVAHPAEQPALRAEGAGVRRRLVSRRHCGSRPAA